MSTPTGTGRFAPGPGQGAAWVREHGAHLMDYAASHLESGRARAAVVAALTAGRTEVAPESVTVRGRLLAALRRDCRTSTGHRERYVPGSGPGMPDALLIERVWTIVDPLGTETLRLMYRHALGMEDLPHVLGMPADEVGRLATRTQDLIETLVSGLDALANGRRTCPELAPLVETVFPGAFPAGRAGGEAASSSTDPDDARTALISHMIRCSACTRPINIRYTVPQMISHPPVAPLSAEERQRLTDSLPPEVVPPTRPHARPARGGSAVLPAPPAGSGVPAAPAPPAVALPAPRIGAPPYPPVASKAPAKPPATTSAGTTSAGTGSASTGSASTASPVTPPEGEPAVGSSDPPGLPPLPALPPRRTRPVRPPSAPPVPGHDTPLYDALLTQAWAREVLAQSEEVTGTIPRQAPPAPQPVARAEPVVIAGQASVEMRNDAQIPALRFHTEPDDRPDEGRIEMGIRVLEALSWAGTRIRNTTIKIVIIVVAGAAGTLTGMNLLGPAIESKEPTRSLQASTSQAGQTTQATQAPPTTDPVADPTADPIAGPTAGAPARRDGLASRLRVPPVVTLDEFGQGSMVLTISGEPLKWRISAPGLAVSPSGGTLRAGVTQVINLRAHRIRNWCGAPASVTAPLTVHSLDDSIGTTVRWRTC
ncbi:hypothetical protein OG884_15910 [Streptosporangium sp. NBC_01755]|uniref:hypothetical protein n=1 Tax=Streptosporangium sp. NBC_01755 TaxID=2975949 RepID=UPI002DD961E4|nr:hypothetical protein [Streptosporangium sp. NBC_01755]WSD03317.1 hypothetical protein OG884_15910 [Streptosporangium sp. NBC_01755]